MSAAEDVIEKLGGTRKVAAAMGLPPSTVQGWKRSGFIPARRQADVIRIAVSLDVEIAAADLISAAPTQSATHEHRDRSAA